MNDCGVVADGVLAELYRSLENVERGLADLRGQLGALPAAPAEEKASAAASESSSVIHRGAAATDAVWQRIFFGDELAASPLLEVARQTLLNDVLAGLPEASAFAGQLLMLHAASVEELPELFHRVGEAYYRWRPRLDDGDDPLERALADWLSRRAEAVGLRNTIQLVRVGERFDGGRHTTNGRGVEVAGVHGWVVLRDNHKIYTKAGVSVK